MGPLAGRARRRLERMYVDAFGVAPQTELKLPDLKLTPRAALSVAQAVQPEVAMGIRVAPIIMTDGLFEYSFSVRDVHEPVRGVRAVYVFARKRWPVFIGVADDPAQQPAEIDAAREIAARHQADELWVANLSPGFATGLERVRLALIQVYSPVGCGGR